MVTYEEIKNWLNKKENKDNVLIGLCFILIFLVGFGTGRFDRSYKASQPKPQTHYTTTDKQNPAPVQAKAAPATPQVAGAATTTSACLIKGNISSTGKKIYHVPSGALYKVVKPEQCFNTEAEALAAGFVKSKR